VAKARSTLMDPPIEKLLEQVDSKFTLVVLGAKRARQVNAYYNSLGEGLGRVVPPQVTTASGNPLSIAFEEVAAGKAVFSRPDPDAVPPEDEGADGGEGAGPDVAPLVAVADAGDGYDPGPGPDPAG